MVVEEVRQIRIRSEEINDRLRPAPNGVRYDSPTCTATCVAGTGAERTQPVQKQRSRSAGP